MNHSERINEIIRLHGHRFAQGLGVGLNESNLILDAKNLGALPGDFKRSLRQIHGCDPSATHREIHCVRTNAAADFQDLQPPPALEFGKVRNMRLDKILTSLNFIEIFPRTHWLRRVPDIAWSRIPIFPNPVKRDVPKGW